MKNYVVTRLVLSERLCDLSVSICNLLGISQKLFIEFETEDLKVFWKETQIQSEKYLLENLCIGRCERLNNIERTFWAEVQQLEESNTNDHFKDLLVKLLVHLEKKIKKYKNKLEKVTNTEYFNLLLVFHLRIMV